ncbi:MAG: sulfur oxidation c-type cytochrome SoxA [Hyphomicrobiaceae bacterium]
MAVRQSFAARFATAVVGLGVVLGLASGAQQARADDEATSKGIEQFRKMLKDDPFANPGYLDADRGETLWRTPKGEAKATLEACDLGKGPGVVDGAFAELPRYFADADRVMDAETRILWCMEKLQGFDAAKFKERPHPSGGAPVKDVGAIATWVATKSEGMPFAAPMAHPKEKKAAAIGEEIFFRRQGPFDFSCATCHMEVGQRIRLQDLPSLSKPAEAQKVVGEWPAYRVSSTHVMTPQHRLYDCYWQMRIDKLDFGSDVSVALTSYLVNTAAGGKVTAPSIKR